MDDLGIPPFEDPPRHHTKLRDGRANTKSTEARETNIQFPRLETWSCRHAQAAVVPTWWGLGFKPQISSSAVWIFCLLENPYEINHAQLLEHCRSGRTETCQPIQDCNDCFTIWHEGAKYLFKSQHIAPWVLPVVHDSRMDTQKRTCSECKNHCLNP